MTQQELELPKGWVETTVNEIIKIIETVSIFGF